MTGDASGLSRRSILALMAAAFGAIARTPGAGAAPAPLMRSIPSTGETIPAVGLGTWQTFDVGSAASEREPLREVLRRFVAAGCRVVDSSPM